MKLGTREDVDAPAAFVFAQLSDFPAWERAALRRGAEVQRIDTLSRPGPGMGWKTGFGFRGRMRRMMVRLDEMTAPHRLAFSGNGSSLDGTLTVELIPMSPRRTRVAVHVEVKPRSLAARLYLQTLRLGKKRAEAKFRERIAALGQEIGERYRHSGS